MTNKGGLRGLITRLMHRLTWLERVALVVSIWFMVFPRPYLPLFIAVIVLPIVGLVLNGIGRSSIASLVTLKSTSKGERYDVADFIDLPAWALLVRVLLDFEFEDWRTLVLPFALATVLITAILLLTHRRFSDLLQHDWLAYVLLVGNCWLYSYGAVYGVNCVFDRSEPTVFTTEVIGKSEHRGRKGGRSYYVHVAPWGHHRDTESIRVTASEYAAFQEGDSVDIDLKAGLLGIPWYFMVKRPDGDGTNPRW